MHVLNVAKTIKETNLDQHIHKNFVCKYSACLLAQKSQVFGFCVNYVMGAMNVHEFAMFP